MPLAGSLFMLTPSIHQFIIKFSSRLSIIIVSIVILLLCNLNIRTPRKMAPKPKLNVQNFPRPPLLERTSRHLQVKWHGQTIADTKEAYWVLETYHAPSTASSILKQALEQLADSAISLLPPH